MTPTRTIRRAGFSLIELLATMALLIFLIGVIGTVFSDSTTAWKLGTSHTDRDNAGRAALDFMTRELTTAVADDLLSFAVENDRGPATFGLLADKLSFVTAAQNPSGSGERACREVVYYVGPMRDSTDTDMLGRYRLMRGVRRIAAKMKSYGNPNWWNDLLPTSGETVIENISAFKVFAFDETTPFNNPVDDYKSTAFGNRLPMWADVYIEVLGEDDAIRVAELVKAGATAQSEEYARRNAKRYVTRVLFENRDRYREL